jgi:hypothetical protein
MCVAREALKKIARYCDEYEERWPKRPDRWIIAGTVGLTVGDLREARQALLEPEDIDRFIATYEDWHGIAIRDSE